MLAIILNHCINVIASVTVLIILFSIIISFYFTLTDLTAETFPNTFVPFTVL